jgi:lysyl-tRNA synthetase, class II
MARRNHMGMTMRQSSNETGIAANGRPWRSLGLTALFAVALACLTMVLAPAALGGSPRSSHLTVRPGHALAQAVTHGELFAPWSVLVDLAIAAAVIAGVATLRAVGRPAAAPTGSSRPALDAARALVDAYGEDSLAPFILRPDKTFEFAAGGVTAYRLIGRTAVVSGDPVAPRDAVPGALGRFVGAARTRGWRVVAYGSSSEHVAKYRRMGLRAVQVGEEAVVDPARFTLEGRPVRKLRQSVHRVSRRGWQLEARDGREIGRELEREMDALERRWRAGRRRLLGFAMSMGEFESGVRPRDLYLLARSPEGELRAVMRFIAHRGKLSLDTMRRVGETPNGLNEALVCRALEVARERGVREVSLNYAGLGHLVRTGPSGGPIRRGLTRAVLRLLAGRFQMERLVRFNEKFAPDWRPRYLVYESRRALLGRIIRVLQAEGYLPERDRRSAAGGRESRPLGSAQAGVGVLARLGR